MNPIFDNTVSPLTKTKRRIIFYLIVFLFALITPAVVFYSLGYRFDFKTGQLMSTGGIFIKTNQTGFKVFINRELTKEANFFSNGVLIIDLKPDLYLVKVEKEGFRPWQRFVHVEGESVSEHRFTMLFPEKIAEKEILDLSRRGLTINTFGILEKSPWLAIRVNERSQLVYLFNRETSVFDAVESFENFRWDAAGRRLLVMRKNPTRWSVVHLSSNKIREEKIALPRKLGTVTAVDFSYTNQNEFLTLNSAGELFRFNKTTLAASKLLSDISVFAVKDSRIWLIAKDGFFYSTDLAGENKENYGRKGYYISESPVEFGVSPAGDSFIVDSGGGFFLRRAGDAEATPLSGNVRRVVFDEAGGKVVFCTDRDINVIWLKDEEHQPFRKAGTREKIIAFPSEEINACDWWGPDEENIIFSAGKFVGVTDIDNRGGGIQSSILYDDIKGQAAFDKETGIILRSEKSFLFIADLY